MADRENLINKVTAIVADMQEEVDDRPGVPDWWREDGVKGVKQHD